MARTSTRGRVEGRVRRAVRVPADRVPDEHSLATAGGRGALALAVESEDGETARAFEPWPDAADSRERVVELLDALDCDASDLDGLAGERVALVREDGGYRVDVERTWSLQDDEPVAERPTHSVTELGIGAGALASVLAVAFVRTPLADLTVPLLGVAVAVLPLALGFDAWHTDTRSWSPRPLRWAAGGCVPVANVAVAAAYLARKAAAVAADEDSEASVWTDLVGGAVVAFGAGLALGAFDPTLHLGATLVVHAWALAPLAVALDASARTGADRPSRVAWVAGSLVLGGAGALLYRLRTA